MMQLSPKTFCKKNTCSLFYQIICLKFFFLKAFKCNSHSKCATFSCTPCIEKKKLSTVAHNLKDAQDLAQYEVTETPMTVSSTRHRPLAAIAGQALGSRSDSVAPPPLGVVIVASGQLLQEREQQMVNGTLLTVNMLEQQPRGAYRLHSDGRMSMQSALLLIGVLVVVVVVVVVVAVVVVGLWQEVHNSNQ